MLVCANQEAENLKDELNAAHNWILTGFTLMLVPFILILNSFFGGLLNFQMDLITKIPHIESVLTRILSVFDISTQIFIYIIFIYILFFILMTFPLVNSPNSKVNSLIKKRKITSVLYEMSLLIFFVILVLKWLLSIKLDLTDSTFVINLLTGSVGLMFHTIGSLMISLNRKNITNANKIILDFENRLGHKLNDSQIIYLRAQLIEKNELILSEPEPFINISEHASSSVNLTVRVWTNTENYWNVYFYLIEEAKLKFDEEKISIPYPQMDLHIKEK